MSITKAPRYDNSYVCSPYSHYITYAIDEIRRLSLKSFVIETFLSLMIAAFGVHLKWLQLDKVAITNNWLFSNNLYPELTKKQIEAITAFMISKYPKHTIMFRCISSTVTGKLKASLTDSGYQMVVSRPVYVVNTGSNAYLKRHNVRRDLKLLQSSDYEETGNRDVAAGDIRRLVQLYNDLYLKKYSYCNPQYNERSFELMVREKICNYLLLRKADRILCFVGLFSLGKAMSSHTMGHDLDAPRELGLYRIIMSICLREAAMFGRLLHWSAGAAEFKCLRGAVPDLEHHAVYHKHLPLYRSLPWRTVAFLFNRVAE